MEERQYSRALHLATGRQINNPAPGMEKEYVAALNGLLDLAEEALSVSDYGGAGPLFKTVLDAYPAEPSLNGKIKITETRLKGYLTTCSSKVMEQGLEEYRRGELEKAIKTWQSVLAFSADDRKAQKAIDTAKVQRKTLQELAR